MTDPAFEPISIQSLYFTGISHCDVLRLDQVHPVISGNKWFKLKYHLQNAIEEKKKGIITFGGAYSNHLVATAAACKLHNLQSIGLVRGEEPEDYSHTLRNCIEFGMQLIFLSRQKYSAKEIPEDYLNDFHIVNEGGYGVAGAMGASEIISGEMPCYTHIVCAVGTGTMLAGLINGMKCPNVIGVSVLKGNYEVEKNVKDIVVTDKINWSVIHDYHFGGYAKHPKQLIDYMNDLYSATGIPTDIVYTSKLFYAVEDLARKGFFPDKSKVLIIHSGGIQGNYSLEKGTLIY